MEIAEAQFPEPVETKFNVTNAQNIRFQVDCYKSKVDKCELMLKDIEQYYSSLNKKQHSSGTPRCASFLKDRDKDRLVAAYKKRQQDAAQIEAAGTKRMQELIRQMGTIIRQITLHKWAGPFMEPVDVEGLKLHDYYDVIEKPMDFSTVKKKMEGKDGSGYKSVREICADVRLIFKNAMKYNEERDDVHVMAKTLLGKFEEKWLQLLPKVDEEETRSKEEEAEAQRGMKFAQEAAYAKMATDLRIELDDAESQLEELREHVLQRCRKMSTEEKRRLGASLTQLSPDDLNKALALVAQADPNFQPSSDEVYLDMDAQSESTLWKLKLFVKDSLHAAGKSSASLEAAENPNNNIINNKLVINNNNNNTNNSHSTKRKREICAALAKSNHKKTKKQSV